MTTVAMSLSLAVGGQDNRRRSWSASGPVWPSSAARSCCQTSAVLTQPVKALMASSALSGQCWQWPAASTPKRARRPRSGKMLWSNWKATLASSLTRLGPQSLDQMVAQGRSGLRRTTFGGRGVSIKAEYMSLDVAFARLAAAMVSYCRSSCTMSASSSQGGGTSGAWAPGAMAGRQSPSRCPSR